MKYIKLLILLAVITSLAVFLNATDFRKVHESLRQIGWKFIILVFVTFLSAILGTLSWRACLGKQANSISLTQLFLIRHIGEIASIFNPAGIVGGEALKIHLLCSSQNLEKKTVLASILVSRAIMIFTQLALVCFVAIWLFMPDLKLVKVTLYPNYLILAVTCLGLICILFYFIRKIIRPGLSTRIYNRYRSITSLYQSNKKALAYSSLYALSHWVVGAMEFYFILMFIGVNVSVFQALLVDMGVIFFKTAGVFIPAQAGIEEYGNKVMLSVIGVRGTEIWITASILRRTRQLFWLGFGICVYLFMYKTSSQRLGEANGNIIR